MAEPHGGSLVTHETWLLVSGLKKNVGNIFFFLLQVLWRHWQYFSSLVGMKSQSWKILRTRKLQGKIFLGQWKYFSLIILSFLFWLLFFFYKQPNPLEKRPFQLKTLGCVTEGNAEAKCSDNLKRHTNFFSKMKQMLQLPLPAGSSVDVFPPAASLLAPVGPWASCGHGANGPPWVLTGLFNCPRDKFRQMCWAGKQSGTCSTWVLPKFSILLAMPSLGWLWQLGGAPDVEGVGIRLWVAVLMQVPAQVWSWGGM